MKFTPSIQFPLLIDAKPVTAFVQEEIDNPWQKSTFHVAFSDGFEDAFILEDDGNVYGSGIAAIPYAKAIRFDIGHLSGIDPTRFYYNYPETVDGMKTNVWVIEGNDEQGEPIYKVYYFEFFRFALRRVNDLWCISHQPRFGREPDAALAEKIGWLLNSLLETSG